MIERENSPGVVSWQRKSGLGSILVESVSWRKRGKGTWGEEGDVGIEGEVAMEE